MKYSDITKTEEIGPSIEYFKRGVKEIDIALYRKQYEVGEFREVMDKTKRRDKEIKNAAGDVQRLEPVNRIPIPIQKRIVNSTVSFTFGNPVELSTEDDSDAAQTIMGAVRRILADNKIDSFNRRVARDLARCTEVAECWYSVEGSEAHTNYGFPTKQKIRARQFSPWNGDSLYPYYDETGDMVAFGRAYSITNGDTRVDYFDLYTDEQIAKWQKDGSTWTGTVVPNVLGKIPIVYGKQENVEWYDVEKLINRLEKLISNFGDTNDYFGSPILLVSGEIRGLADKDATGKTFQLEGGADAKFLNWEQAPEAIKLEMETLLRFIYNLTQTPDISFDSVKGLPDVSGETLKMLFLDAHLKVQDKREVFDEYLQRRMNIIKAFVGTMNTKLKTEASNMEIVPKIIPFMISNEKDTIDRLITANGGKAIISQKTSVALSGLVNDVEQEYKDLEAEQEKSQLISITEPSL